MRTLDELQSTRDRYAFRALSSQSLGDQALARFLDYVLDPTISELELANILEEINEEPNHEGCCPGDGDCCTENHCTDFSDSCCGREHCPASPELRAQCSYAAGHDNLVVSR